MSYDKYKSPAEMERELTQAAEAHADEVMATVGKLWTRHAIREALVTAHIAGFCAAKSDSIALLESVTGAAREVNEPREEYTVDSQGEPAALNGPRPMRTNYGFAVQIHAGAVLAPPNVQDVLRSCEPSPALVKLLADSATAWAKAGRLDDAAAALALGLCARSAWHGLAEFAYTGEQEAQP